MELDGSGAIVSGGASGLGEATVRALIGRGARVVIADLNADFRDKPRRQRLESRFAKEHQPHQNPVARLRHGAKV